MTWQSHDLSHVIARNEVTWQSHDLSHVIARNEVTWQSLREKSIYSYKIAHSIRSDNLSI